MLADIRPARAVDVDALAAIENAAFDSDRISRRSFARLINSPSAAVLVAGPQESAEGYCVVLFRRGSRQARLYSIAVSNNAPRGLGRRLLAAAEAEALRRGAAMLRLEVRRDNGRAIALYERNAYRPAGEAPDYYADGMTALRYEKPLGAETLPAAGTASS